MHFFLSLDENTDAMKYLLDANSASKWACEIYSKYIAFVLGSNLMLVFSSAFICWVNKGHFDTNYVAYVSRIMLVYFHFEEFFHLTR